MKQKLSIFFFLMVFSGLAAFLPVSARAACSPSLAKVNQVKNDAKLLDADFINKDNWYQIKYNSAWQVSEGDFDNFSSPDLGVSGVSLAVPHIFFNGGELPKSPPLRKAIVKINGQRVEWRQWWVSEQCLEIGEIRFLKKSKDFWHIEYAGTKQNMPLIKAMIYSVQLLSDYQPSAIENTLVDGDRIVQKGYTEVSYFTKGRRHSIPYSVYDGWYNDGLGTGVEIPESSEIKQLNAAQFYAIPKGNIVCHRPGSLLHFYDDPRIYYVGTGCAIHSVTANWIAQWYGNGGSGLAQEWNTLFKKNYKVGKPYKDTSLPEGSVVLTSAGDTWYIDKDGKRSVTAEGVVNNNFIKFLFVENLPAPESIKGPLSANEFFLPYQGLKKAK